ncbi:MAG: sulfur carrier protein ThiS [Phycisphaerales bacterium]|nr:sulfur carrier protein ThiS [Phycisphaerales bacterium]
MKIVVNGQTREVPEGTSVESLVTELGLAKAACAAEVNKKLVPNRERAGMTLREGDVVEVVTLVGGG